MGDLVSLVKVDSTRDDVKNSIGNALDLIDFKPKGPLKCVDIKPNLCYYWQSATGSTTDPRVVSGVIDLVRDRYGSDVHIRVVEADATAMKTKHVFNMLGYEKLASEKKVELFNLCDDQILEENVSVNGRRITFQIPQSLLKSDLFISVPKLKIARETVMTCGLKNIFGCIAYPKKIVYHPLLDEAIVGVNKILNPDLTLVDGIVALGRFPIRLGLIMASRDPFSADWIASKVMGLNPSKIGFLKRAMKEKVGDLRGIETRGENTTAFTKIFPKQSRWSTKRWWNAQLGLLRLYFKISGDVVPPQFEGEFKG
jgi:uncharacterized protein (DUF362 family)